MIAIVANILGSIFFIGMFGGVVGNLVKREGDSPNLILLLFLLPVFGLLAFLCVRGLVLNF